MTVLKIKLEIVRPALVWVLAGLLVACGADRESDNGVSVPAPIAEPEKAMASIQVANPSSLDRDDQVIQVDLAALGVARGDPVDELVFTRNGSPVAHQAIDNNGDGYKDSVLLVTDLKGSEQTQYRLHRRVAGGENPVSRTHAEIGVKAGGRWNGSKYEGGVFQDVEAITLPPQYTDHAQFIRYEGPGIESELIGYRLYLDWRNGFDIFGKQRRELVLENVGQDGYDSYHEMADWGMDILKVGESVGVGGFGFWHQGELLKPSAVKQRGARIVEDGPLYSAFAIDYGGWELPDQDVDLQAQLAMYAGSRLVDVRLDSEPALEELAVGIGKLPGTEVLRGSLDITGEAWTYLATLGPQSLDGRRLALFVLFQREDFVAFAEDEHNHVVRLKVRGGELNYQFGALWEGEPEADLSRQGVEALLQDEVRRLTIKPRIRIANKASDHLKQERGGVEAALYWSQQVAESEIKRHGMEMAHDQYDTMRQRKANWEYTMGLLTQSVYLLGKAVDDSRLVGWARTIVDSYVTGEGEIRTYDPKAYNIDSVNAGKMLLQLYRDTGDEKYRLAADRLRAQLETHPRLEAGAFWHKQRYPYQLWLDGVYMGMPFLAEYSILFEDGHSLDEVWQEFAVVRDRLRDPETGLYYHAWDERSEQPWADPETGLSAHFWGRGMGWLAMALVDTLEFIPETRADIRAAMVDMSVELAQALVTYQTDNGVWLQIVDRPGATGNYAESSASAMFTYFLVKGLNDRILPDTFRAPAQRAYEGLISEFLLLDANGNLHVTQACEVAGLGFGRDGSYDYYMSEQVISNDPKVLGPFIQLGVLLDDMTL